MPQRRFHPINPALIAHAVPLWGCERTPFLFGAGLCLVPIASTGVMHWQPDLFAVLVFFPVWFGLRLMYLYDPRCVAKTFEHLTWASVRYCPRIPFGAKLATSKSRSLLRLVGELLKQATRS